MQIDHSHIEYAEEGFAYLAGPYTHKTFKKRWDRYCSLTKVAAKLMISGHTIYSPITQGHTAHRMCEMPVGWDGFWKRQSLNMLSQASRLIVVMLDGWEESVGVQAEIEHATLMAIPIYYIGVTHEA